MIFVTGGTGLVGSHLLFNLVHSGAAVRALRRENSSFGLVKKVFGYYSSKPEELLGMIEWVSGDVTDIFSLNEALEGVEKVYHAAAVVSFHPADRNEIMKINVDGTANVVNACLNNGVKKICHVSSIAALGRAENNKITDEETEWKSSKNNSLYSISKYEAEREVWRGSIEGLPAVIVNPAVIIGPGDREKGSSQLFDLVWNGLKYYTDGVNGYVDVRDVSKAMVALMESDAVNSRFIISSENISYYDFFKMIAEGFGKNIPNVKVTPFLSGIAWRAEKIRSLLTGKKPVITKETARTAMQQYFYSNEKIRNTLGFEFIPVSVSINDTCRLFLKELS